ncbi:MAG: hypothetical protein ACI8ZW_001698 [Yoonia sp.]|jgi:hypothetical protein
MGITHGSDEGMHRDSVEGFSAFTSSTTQAQIKTKMDTVMTIDIALLEIATTIIGYRCYRNEID